MIEFTLCEVAGHHKTFSNNGKWRTEAAGAAVLGLFSPTCRSRIAPPMTGATCAQFLPCCLLSLLAFASSFPRKQGLTTNKNFEAWQLRPLLLISGNNPTRHIVRSAHDAPPSPPKSVGGMKTADAAVPSAMTARTIRFAPSSRAQAKQSMHRHRKQQTWIASLAFAPRDDAVNNSRHIFAFSRACLLPSATGEARSLLSLPLLWGRDERSSLWGGTS